MNKLNKLNKLIGWLNHQFGGLIVLLFDVTFFIGCLIFGGTLAIVLMAWMLL